MLTWAENAACGGERINLRMLKKLFACEILKFSHSKIISDIPLKKSTEPLAKFKKKIILSKSTFLFL